LIHELASLIFFLVVLSEEKRFFLEDSCASGLWYLHFLSAVLQGGKAIRSILILSYFLFILFSEPAAY